MKLDRHLILFLKRRRRLNPKKAYLKQPDRCVKQSFEEPVKKMGYNWI